MAQVEALAERRDALEIRLEPMGHAVALTTWLSLSSRGLDDDDAAELMTQLMTAVARPSHA